MMASSKLRGVYCPVLTPFDEQLRPDASRFTEHCKSLLRQGCQGLAVFGTTGEANSLSVKERIELLEALLKAGIAPELIVPGTGCAALTDTISLTRHAFQSGCAGVLILPPFYYKAVEENGLYRSFATVIEDIGDTSLNVYLYHIPPVSGVPLELPLIKRLVKDFPNNVVGLKDSSGVWEYTDTLLKTLPNFSVFSGSEIFLRDNLLGKGCGTITASANINAPAICSLFEDWEGSNGAKRQAEITTIRKTVQNFPLIPALKAVVANNLKDSAWLRVRPPLVPLSPSAHKTLLESLSQVGYIPPN
ncbi:MAG: dihydrodipicolinate synthase family protein [Pseudomonadota bacterium]|nr:dihydrodipicolinate synthase family protein [Pseudomonadota bacterium]